VKAHRPPYMAQNPVQVFQFPRVDAGVIFSIPIGELRWRKKFWERNKCHDA